MSSIEASTTTSKAMKATAWMLSGILPTRRLAMKIVGRDPASKPAAASRSI